MWNERTLNAVFMTMTKFSHTQMAKSKGQTLGLEGKENQQSNEGKVFIVYSHHNFSGET